MESQQGSEANIATPKELKAACDKIRLHLGIDLDASILDVETERWNMPDDHTVINVAAGPGKEECGEQPGSESYYFGVYRQSPTDSSRALLEFLGIIIYPDDMAVSGPDEYDAFEVSYQPPAPQVGVDEQSWEMLVSRVEGGQLAREYDERRQQELTNLTIYGVPIDDKVLEMLQEESHTEGGPLAGVEGEDTVLSRARAFEETLDLSKAIHSVGRTIVRDLENQERELNVAVFGHPTGTVTHEALFGLTQLLKEKS